MKNFYVYKYTIQCNDIYKIFDYYKWNTNKKCCILKYIGWNYQ